MKYETEIDFNSRNTVTIFIDLIKDNSKVLEFGAASGRLTKYLKEKKFCEVLIVEIDEEAAEIAKQYAADFFVGDIMEYGWADKFVGYQFDYILFADVLEHLSRPEEVLAKVREFMKDEGKILISLPNIAYNGVLLGLYKNNFRYSETGILDSTHLHFWTLNEAKKVFSDLGYGVELVDATYNLLKDSEFEADYNMLPCVIADSMKSRVYGEIYQLIFLLSKDKDIKTKEKIYKYTDYLYVQCFLGTGETWDDSDDIKYPVDLNECNWYEEIILPKDVKEFRLDPLNTHCIVRVKVVDQNGVEISSNTSNGIQIEDVFCFDHKDSQIMYKIKPETEILKIKLEYIMYCKDSIYRWVCNSIKAQRAIIEQKENYIIEQRAIIEQKENYTIEQRAVIEQKENYIIEQRTVIEQKENYIIEQRATIEQKENYITEQRERLEQQDNQIRKINVIVEQKENYICEQREMLEQRDNEIRELNGIIEQKENYICEQRDILRIKDERIRQFEEFVSKKGVKEFYNLYLKANERVQG